MTYPYVWVCSTPMRRDRPWQHGTFGTGRAARPGRTARPPRGQHMAMEPRRHPPRSGHRGRRRCSRENHMRTLACGLLLAAVSPCAIAADVTGVAFVHGTGSQSNAYQDYWQPRFVDSVRQGLPDSANYTVINCDFTQYMWDSRAAGCLAGQLTTFINNRGITRLVVLTHSNGGNVMRWILSNPTWDSRFPAIISRVVRVNALAPSSAGTPLADAVINGNVFETSLGWLLGYKSDAVRQQQVSWMAYYNANNLYGTSGRPALPKAFRSVVGTDVDSAIWDGDSYCGGYAENVGLEP